MPKEFKPVFRISPKIARSLMDIEAARERVSLLPITPIVLSSLRESAKLMTTHYSTMIEGNSLSPVEVNEVVIHEGHFPGRDRDEKEVKGYYAALARVEEYVAQNATITEKQVQTLHALVMSDGRRKVRPTPYREGQNVIKDGASNAIVYMPPEAKDVGPLMAALVHWLKVNGELPTPILGAIVHYQFATIHPYYDGNGRTARLLTTMVLHLGGYGLKGLYSLEEYYARNLLDYYRAISVGPSHNYYLGREQADITDWIEYFCLGMADACNKVARQVEESSGKGGKDYSAILRKLDPKQRKALELFKEYEIVTSHQIGELFGFQPRTSAALCKKWVDSGFLEMVNSARKGRTYKLAAKHQKILTE